jgi:predicted RNase H-like HicB family nuclease
MIPATDSLRVEYTVIYEDGPTSWGAWVPDIPGCVAAGETRAEVQELITEAIVLHIESLREHNESGPEPRSTASSVAVAP